MELKKIKELITVGSGDLIGTSLSATILGLNFGIIGVTISLIISSSTKVGFYLIDYIRRNAI